MEMTSIGKAMLPRVKMILAANKVKPHKIYLRTYVNGRLRSNSKTYKTLAKIEQPHLESKRLHVQRIGGQPKTTGTGLFLKNIKPVIYTHCKQQHLINPYAAAAPESKSRRKFAHRMHLSGFRTVKTLHVKNNNMSSLHQAPLTTKNNSSDHNPSHRQAKVRS